MEIKPYTIELDLGWKDAKGVTHKKVTFGKQLTGKQLFLIDDDPQSELATQYGALLLRAKITEFGTLTMPVTLKALLELDSIDRDDLNEASNKFSEAMMGDRKPEMLPDNKIRLAVGYERNGATYDVVEFGIRLTGMSEVEADKLGLKGTRRVCFLAGKQISKLSQSDGESVLEGPLEAQFLFEVFEALDVSDIMVIRAGSEIYRQSFRRAGAAVQGLGSANGNDHRAENRVERS